MKTFIRKKMGSQEVKEAACIHVHRYVVSANKTSSVTL